MNNASSSNTPKVIGALLGVAIIGAGVAWFLGYGRTPDQADTTATTAPDQGSTTSAPAAVTPSTTTTAPSATPAPAPTPGPKTAYKNGTYTASGVYVSPGGGQSVTVALTVKGDVVTDATFTEGASDPTSRMWQSRFASGYKAQVIGKKLDQVSVGVVNGSSLTSRGFMDAVAKIQAQAKA